MAPFIQDYENCCIITVTSGRRVKAFSRKIEDISHRQKWAAWVLWKEGFKLPDVHRRLSAVCGQKAPAYSTVCNWVRNFQWQGNWTGGCPSVVSWHPETEQAAVHQLCRDTPKLNRRLSISCVVTPRNWAGGCPSVVSWHPERMVSWHHSEAAKEMVTMYNLRREYFELAVI
jgi:hypothetical protein